MFNIMGLLSEEHLASAQSSGSGSKRWVQEAHRQAVQLLNLRILGGAGLKIQLALIFSAVTMVFH